MEKQRMKVLVIEDNQADQVMIEAFFQQLSYEKRYHLIFVASINEAKEILADKKLEIDVIISDILLPDSKNINELCNFLNEYKNIPSIILTMNEDVSQIGRMTAPNIYEYLIKGQINQNVLERSIQFALERYRMDKEKESINKKLINIKNIQDIGILAGGLAHELNNKLNLIDGHISLLRRSSSKSPDDIKNLDYMENKIQEIFQITQKILAYGQKRETVRKVMPLNKVIQGNLKIFENIFKKHLKFELTNNSTLDLNIEIDAIQWEQILLNIITNASEAMNGKGTVYVTLSTATQNHQEYVSIKIEDDGEGIPKEILNEVCLPFFTTKNTSGNMGLGLSEVMGLVRQNAGVLKIESRSANHKGAGVEILFPLAKKIQTNIEKTKKIEIHTILYAEDTLDNLELFSTFFSEEGINVIQAHEGNKALNVFKENKDKIQLVVLDVMMPGMDGVELAEKILEISPEMRFLFVSGYSNSQVCQSKKLVNKYKYIPKPISATGMLNAIINYYGTP